MPDDRSGKKGFTPPARPDPPKNPLRDISITRPRPTGGLRTTVPRFDGRGGSIPVLDHRVSPTPWASPNTVAPNESADVPEMRSATVLSAAERARTIAGSARTGVLATVVGDPAAPIGFVVNFSSAEDGNPVLCVNRNIERLGCIAHNASASFSVAETPLTAVHSAVTAGVTLAGTLQEVTGNDVKKYLPNHVRTHGGDDALVKREEAHLFLLKTVAVLLSGRNEVERVSFNEFSNADVDPLAMVAPGLAQHLSGDENGSLVLLARAYANQSDAKSAKLLGIDRLGLDLMVKTPHGSEPVRLGFPNPVSTPEEVRKELNTMIRGARFKLGVG